MRYCCSAVLVYCCAVAGRGGAREPGTGSSSNYVVRVWELADAEAKVQYSAHVAAVHQVGMAAAEKGAYACISQGEGNDVGGANPMLVFLGWCWCSVAACDSA